MRTLATAAFSFAAAVFAAQYFLAPGQQLAAAGTMAALAVLALLLRGKTRVRTLLMTFSLCVGFVYNFTYTALVQEEVSDLAGREYAAGMELCEYAEATEYGARAAVKLLGDGGGMRAVYYGGEALLELSPGFMMKVCTANPAELRDSFTVSP